MQQVQSLALWACITIQLYVYNVYMHTYIHSGVDVRVFIYVYVVCVYIYTCICMHAHACFHTISITTTCLNANKIRVYSVKGYINIYKQDLQGSLSLEH